MTQDLYIFNTLSKQKELFVPLRPPFVKMYVCGMTVYDFCHLGHARVLIFFDVVQHYLRYLGFNVHYIRNITDIDDKIIKRAHENNEDINHLTARFIDEMDKDSLALGVEKPTQEPRATQYIAPIIQMIDTLIANNYAYVAENGDVCFEVAKFPTYGQLSKQELSQLRAGARVSIFESKRDPLDFVLWKLSKPDEPQWDSPWGAGRPGWHIECSAMSTKCLGTHFDIHGGGLDLTFPHHENEIAQSEGATGEKFVNTWMHVGYVQINKEKMSKSLGNFFTVRDILQRHRGEVIRYFMLTSHYRSPINYAEEYLVAAQTALQRCYAAMLNLTPVSISPEFGQEYREKFLSKMNDDFNTSEAIAVLFDIVREINRLKDNGETNTAEFYAALLRELGGILGLLQDDPQEFWQNANAMDVDTHLIEDLVAQRQQARNEKNWQKADEIRQKLLSMGIVVEDSTAGSVWRRG